MSAILFQSGLIAQTGKRFLRYKPTIGKNENLLDNSRGGYFEVKVRRNSSGNPEGINTAFWFDSPGGFTILSGGGN